MVQKFNKNSMNILGEKYSQLKKLFPECFTENKIDLDKLKISLGSIIGSNDEKYTFNWAGRKDTFRNIQTPSKGNLIADKSESINFDDTENLFIDGDNLEVLKLLQKSYFEKIKLIYIDPPYNTGHDFIYHDDFKNSIQSYLEQTGQSDEGIKLTTNPETSGRFHSNWISFMYARLFLARNLLRDDGILVVSIDDNESYNLRIILNEIFGEENFCADVSWQKRYTRSNNTADFTTVVEHLFFYSKSDEFSVNLLERTEIANARYTNPDNDPRGPWKGSSFLNPASPQQRPNLCYTITNPNTGKKTNPTSNAWRRSLDEFERLQNEGRLYWGLDGKNSVPSIKMYLSEARQITPINFWDHQYAGNTDDGTKDLAELFGKKIFDNPKPTQLIKRVIEHSCQHDDIVLDFFCGSGTTAHAVLEKNLEDNKNLKFICVQLPEKIDSDTVAFNSGYKTISEIGKERIRRVIKKIKENNQNKLDDISNMDLGFKVFKLAQSNFKIWENYEEKDEKKLKEQMKLFESPLVEKYKDEDVIYECIIKEGFDLNSKIEQLDIKTNKVHKISDNDVFFYLCIDKSIKDDTVNQLNLTKEDTFICIDDALNDSKKTNLAKQCVLKTM